jgi:putative transposase
VLRSTTQYSKSHGSLDVGLVEQLDLVQDLQESHSLTTVCEAFGLPRSTVKYRQSAVKRIGAERVELNAMVKAAHTVSNGSAGARSIAHIVTRQGMPLSRYRAPQAL